MQDKSLNYKMYDDKLLVNGKTLSFKFSPWGKVTSVKIETMLEEGVQILDGCYHMSICGEGHNEERQMLQYQ